MSADFHFDAYAPDIIMNTLLYLVRGWIDAREGGTDYAVLEFWAKEGPSAPAVAFRMHLRQEDLTRLQQWCFDASRALGI
jgi:hypothetical protein